MVLIFLLTGCSGNKSNLPTVQLDTEQVPLLHTEDAISLISDSTGMTRFRIKTAEWNVYSDKNNGEYWYFPKGAYAERLDSLLKMEASVEADTVYYFRKKEIWHLIQNVVIINQEKTKFETSEMFWNEKERKVYSDSVVTLTYPNGNVLYFIGFSSDSEMKNPVGYKVSSGPITVQMKDDQPDSLEVNNKVE